MADCRDEELINSYDNSILATDTYWKELAERLKTRNALLMITADHGDRLHGARGHSPELMDHPELRWVPLMLYASEPFKSSRAHLDKWNEAERHAATPCSHDVLFHSLLGIAGIQTPAYREEMDVFSGKMLPHKDPYTEIQGLEQTLPR